ncbi:unnamed protein product, partial [Hapterophycus canaliculatus]
VLSPVLLSFPVANAGGRSLCNGGQVNFKHSSLLQSAEAIYIVEYSVLTAPLSVAWSRLTWYGVSARHWPWSSGMQRERTYSICFACLGKMPPEGIHCCRRKSNRIRIIRKVISK